MELDNAQHELFCRYYAADLKGNATEAAKRAGYGEKGAHVQGSRLLKDVKVKARIRELRREVLRECGFEVETLRSMIMDEFAKMAFADITDVVHISPGSDDPERGSVMKAIAEANGGQRLLDFGETVVVPTPYLSSDVTAAIKSIDTKHDKDGMFQGFKVEMHDKKGALLALAEISGIKNNTLALTNADGEPLVINWANRDEADREDVADEGNNDTV